MASKIAEEISTLDKLSWAVFSERTKIARAAHMLRRSGYSRWSLDVDKEPKRELRRLVHLTAPGRGKIMSREEEIKEEVGRQANIAARRHDRRPDAPVEKTEFRIAVEASSERQWHKQNLIREFGRKLNINGLNAFLKLPDGTLLLFAGGWSGFRDLYVRRRYGAPVYHILTNQNRSFERIEDFLAELPLLATDYPDPNGLLAEVLLSGSKLMLDWQGFRTVVERPNGERTAYRWWYQMVSLDG